MQKKYFLTNSMWGVSSKSYFLPSFIDPVHSPSLDHFRGPPRGFGEQGNKGNFFRGTGEQRSKNKGNRGYR